MGFLIKKMENLAYYFFLLHSYYRKLDCELLLEVFVETLLSASWFELGAQSMASDEQDGWLGCHRPSVWSLSEDQAAGAVSSCCRYSGKERSCLLFLENCPWDPHHQEEKAKVHSVIGTGSSKWTHNLMLFVPAVSLLTGSLHEEQVHP